MESTSSDQQKKVSLETIRNFRVYDLQALLEFARLPRSGNKKELFARCYILVSEKWSNQLYNKIKQIETMRKTFGRNSIFNKNFSQFNETPIAEPKEPSTNLVRFKTIPFINPIKTIDSSEIFVDRRSFSALCFFISDAEIESIRQGSLKVIIRLVSNNKNLQQSDVLPAYFYAQCNNRTVINNNEFQPPGTPAHSFAFPVDITDRVYLSNPSLNKLEFYWLQLPVMCGLKNLPDFYTVAVQLVKYRSLDDLISNIIKRPISSDTKENVKPPINENDFGLETTRQSVSLICPISQTIIKIPAKSLACSHLACFDLRAFLQMNQRRIEWHCPLCNKLSPFESLILDSLIKSILENLPKNCSTVQIDTDTNQYSFLSEKEKNDQRQENVDENSTENFIILSDSENSPIKQSSSSSSTLNNNGKRPLSIKSPNHRSNQRKKMRSSPLKQNFSNQVEIIVLSSSDSSDFDENAH